MTKAKSFKRLELHERLFYALVLALIALELLFLAQVVHGWMKSEKFIFFTSPLFWHDASDYFMDFFKVNHFVSDVSNDPYRVEGSNYPPLALLIAKAFALFADYSGRPIDARATAGGIISFAILYVGAFICLFWLLKRYLRQYGMGSSRLVLILVAFFLCAPMLYLIQRGNYLILTLALCAVFFTFRESKNRVVRELSYLCLALAVGIKIYPAAFALILLKERKIFDLCRTAGYSLVLLTLPFLCFEGGFSNIPVLIENLLYFSGNVKVVDMGSVRYAGECSFNLSARNVMLVIANKLMDFDIVYPPVWLYALTNALSAIIGAALLFAILLSKEQWKSVAACALATIVVVNPSFTYAAVFMLLPCVLFLAHRQKSRRDWLYALLFVLILSPLQFGYFLPKIGAGTFGVTNATFMQGAALMLFSLILCADAAMRLRGIVKGKKIKEEEAINEPCKA